MASNGDTTLIYRLTDKRFYRTAAAAVFPSRIEFLWPNNGRTILIDYYFYFYYTALNIYSWSTTGHVILYSKIYTYTYFKPIDSHRSCSLFDNRVVGYVSGRAVTKGGRAAKWDFAPGVLTLKNCGVVKCYQTLNSTFF